MRSSPIPTPKHSPEAELLSSPSLPTDHRTARQHSATRSDSLRQVRHWLEEPEARSLWAPFFSEMRSKEEEEEEERKEEEGRGVLGFRVMVWKVEEEKSAAGERVEEVKEVVEEGVEGVEEVVKKRRAMKMVATMIFCLIALEGLLMEPTTEKPAKEKRVTE